MLKGNNNLSYNFICVSIVDPVVDMLEIEQILTAVSVDEKGIINKSSDKMFVQTSRLVYKAWLSHYPQLRKIVLNSNYVLLYYAITLILNISKQQ